MENKKEPLIIDGEMVDEMELCPECKTPLITNEKEAECPGCGYYEG